MNYVYMNNYRGFDETFIPIDETTFLVGENSTGKSSFLKLLYLFSQPQFWFAPTESFNEDVEMCSFTDIVSAWSSDKSQFQVGLLALNDNVDGNDANNFNFISMEFKEDNGSPALSKLLYVKDSQIIQVIFQKKQTKYKVSELQDIHPDCWPSIAFAKKALKVHNSDNVGYKLLPRDFPPNPPVPILLSVIKNLQKGKFKPRPSFEAELPRMVDLTWIAPIRTSPQRFYDGLRHSFSPEGEHTPFLLKRSLRSQAKSSDFTKKLEAFGNASGLFDTVTTHSFSRTPQSPFEILIKFSGADLNISNVGYGVSQVLPLIVEFLSKSNKKTFAVQQPEVHLHPKAQAALGDLIYVLAEERNHKFVIETHSDFLIDRFRLALSKNESKVSSKVVFFSRREKGNKATIIEIDDKGRYSSDQPREFRDFFIKEDMKMLDL